MQAPAPLCVLQNHETDLLAVEYSKLDAYMIESIKALKRKCDELEEQLADQSVPRQAKKSRKQKNNSRIVSTSSANFFFCIPLF